MTVLIFFLAALAIVLLIQGAVTMVAAWIVTGRRPALAAVIKAILLSVLAYVITLVISAFQLDQLQALGLPWPLLLLAVLILPLLISCWVFARCLDINLLQAFATNLLTGAAFMALSYFSTPYLPMDRLQPGSGTQFTAWPLPHSPATGAWKA